MKALKNLILIFSLAIISGCSKVHETQQEIPLQTTPEETGIFLSIDFQKGKSLKYKFVSNRNITVDWGPSRRGSKTSRNLKRTSERAVMIFSYRPVEVNPYGTTTIKAKCESVSVKRTGDGTSNQDALTRLRGKTYTLKIDSRGLILDYSSLKELAEQLGEGAFRSNTEAGRIKNPDMVRDFIATQWFLWDSISSIENPAEGVSKGQTWQSQLSVPLPMMVKTARDVTYTLKEVQEGDQGSSAVITSKYSLGEPIPDKWSFPYEGPFRMRGQFGFFSKYNVLSLEGSGQQSFDIDAGRITRDRQNYRVELEAMFPMPVGDGEKLNPKITIRQSITMEYLED
ncbi:MAG: hypothetical protein ACYSSP_05800 [Planctomycetota bacterium]